MGPILLLLPLMASAAQGSKSNSILWHWDRDDPGCGLIQNVDDATVVEVHRLPGNDQTVVVVRSMKPLITVETTLHGGRFALLPAGPVAGDVTVLQGADGRRSISIVSHDPAFLDKFAGSTKADVSNEKIGETTLPIQAAAAAAGGLRTCEDTKMKQWDIDPAAWRALPVKPLPKTRPETWIGWSDYPDRERIYKNDIDVLARLDLGADGSVLGCKVVNQPPAEFIGATCKALRQSARLQPARDASGNPTPASYVVAVRFGAFSL